MKRGHDVADVIGDQRGAPRVTRLDATDQLGRLA
jgi:hypothetical protein